MKPIRYAMRVVPALVLALAGTAGAQSRPLQIVRDTPVAEVGGDVGLFNLMGWSLFGGHVTRNYTSWLAGEAALHGKSGDEKAAVPGYAVFVAAARLQGRVSDGRLAFVTVGAARAVGLSYRYSPVIGLGLQSTWQPGSVGWRVDLQRFPRGAELYGGSRLLVGFVVVP